ncbi:MAG TPA: PAS domain S-box protein, partial [Blastocatellia bacterium]|nr:PAS domain S-box protein [Blastocatellia bacterium]
MDSTEQPLVTPPRGLDKLPPLGKLGLKIVSIRLGVLALILMCLCGAAAFYSTYLSIEGLVTESNAVRFRAASFNAAAGALLALVTVCAGGLAVARAITTKLERVIRATREASGGNLEVRIDASEAPVLDELIQSFNEMLCRMSETAHSEAAQKQSLLAIIKAVEGSGDAIAVSASSREGTYYNKKFTEIFGSDFNGTGDKSRLYVDPRIAAEVSQAVARGDSWSGEIEMRSRSGKIIPVSLRSDAIRDDHGQVTGRIEIHTDISQRRRAELLQSALYRVAEMTGTTEELQAFFSGVHQIVSELMYAGNFFIALYDPETEIVSFPYFVDEADAPPASRKLKKGMTEYVLRTGKALLAPRETMHSMITAKEIEVIGTLPVDWLGIPLKVGDDTVGVLAVQSYKESARYGEADQHILTFVAQHISSALNRKRNQDALRQSEEMYRTILESIEDGYYEVDLKGNMTFFNDPV